MVYAPRPRCLTPMRAIFCVAVIGLGILEGCRRPVPPPSSPDRLSIDVVGCAAVLRSKVGTVCELADSRTLRVVLPVGAVSVHGFAGIWGVLAVGLLSSESGVASAGYADPTKYGLLLGGGAEQLGIQALGVVAIAGWTVATAGVLFGALKVMGQLRVSEEEEHRGLDLLEHGIDAYPDFGPSAEGIFAPTERSGMSVSPGVPQNARPPVSRHTALQ